MNKVNLLYSLALVCGLGALLLEVVASRTLGRGTVLALLLLLTIAAVSVSLHLRLRGERQHRWALSGRVKQLENDLAKISKVSSLNPEPRAHHSTSENEAFDIENYATLARIYDRIQALESDKGWD